MSAPSSLHVPARLVVRARTSQLDGEGGIGRGELVRNADRIGHEVAIHGGGDLVSGRRLHRVILARRFDSFGVAPVGDRARVRGMPIKRDNNDSDEPDLVETCAICGRRLWSDGLPPAIDGGAWICGDCDQARNF